MQTAWLAVSGSSQTDRLGVALNMAAAILPVFLSGSRRRFSCSAERFFATLVAFFRPLPVSNTPPVSATHTSQVFPQSFASPSSPLHPSSHPISPAGPPPSAPPVQPCESEDDGLSNAAGRQTPGPPPFFSCFFFLFSKSQRILTTTERRQRGDTKNAE